MTNTTPHTTHTAACWGIAGVLAVVVFAMALGFAQFSVIVSLAWAGVLFLASGIYLMWMLCPEELGIGLESLSSVPQSTIVSTEMSPMSPVAWSEKTDAQGRDAE